MPNRTQLIYSDNPGAVPATYPVPPSMDLVLQSVVVKWDGSSAAGAFLPVLAVRSQDGQLVGRFHPGSQVEAGDTATVTYAPFLRASSASSVELFDHFWAYGTGTATGVNAIPSGVVTPLTTAGRAAGNGFSSALAYDPVFTPPFTIKIYDGLGPHFGQPMFLYTFTLRVEWASFAGDRYIELTSTTPATDFSTKPLPARLRQGATPDGDQMTVTATIIPTGNTTGYKSVFPNVFQASGVAQAITYWQMNVIAHAYTGIP